MADFRTHALGAMVVAGALTLPLSAAGALNGPMAAQTATAVIAGGILPDIDADASVPVRIAFTLLAAIAAGGVALAVATRLSLSELLLLTLAVFLLVRYGVFSVFAGFTVHRGLIHSLPAAAVFGLGLTVLAWRWLDVDALRAWLIGGALFIGCITHLILDELASVDITGARVSRAFGTALSLGSANQPVGTFAFYAAAAGLVWLAPPPDIIGLWLNQAGQRLAQWPIWPQQPWLTAWLGL